jgi:uncharacterized protein (TIGR03435 family)
MILAVRYTAGLLLATLTLASVGAQQTLQTQSPPAFDVVSIKPAEFSSQAYFEGFTAGAGGGCGFFRFTPVGPRVSFGITTVCSLIRMAYDVKDYQVLSMPPRMAGKEQSSWYAVEARAAADVTLTIEQTRLMLQTMLAERFKLKFHREPRQAHVYALVVAKEGHKLGTVPQRCADTRMSLFVGAGMLGSCQPGMPVSQLAFSLDRYLDRPVVDRTGLAGTYPFLLEWAGNDPLGGADGRPSLFTAVQEQLGLRLEASTDTVDAIVVDSVESPSPN